ncbi:PucR family transcriptional regulator ligand-binding domain-containing protein [Conexibacter arvalis]|uniref:Purine catabolism regulator n=1 Tax=Conexibacter arvalis TaxID=912552 RepID=A0A840IHF3_9ACTN|nr:purine catabolism regulator [Conexibacter arvalis]
MSDRAEADTTAAADGGATGALSVAAALRLEALAVGAPELLAGAAGLDRPIRRAHAGEVPNLASFLRGGELLLTTGMGLRDDAAMRRFVAELADRGVAAVVLELGSAFESAPRALVDAAAEHDLPLIALHREVPFVEVVEAVDHELIDRQLLHVARAEAIHSQLTGLMLDGAGIPEVLGALAAIVANPVVLEREDGELLFHAVHRRDSAEALAAWDAVRRELPGAPPSIAVPLPSGRDAQRGRLVTVAVDSPLAEVSELALQRAGGLVALMSRQLRQEEMLVARERGNLLQGLLEQELGEAEIARQVDAMGFPRRVPYLLPCVLAGRGPAWFVPQGSRATVWTMVWREVRQELESQLIPVLGGLMAGDRQIALVVGLSTAKQREARADALTALFAAALERQFGSREAGLLYVGDTAPSWTGVISSLGEVVQAAASPRPEIKGWYDATRPDLQRLLWSLREAADLRAFVDRRLATLIEYDRRRNAQLLPTLEVYLAFGGRKADAARALHLERQSLYHRISRIETLLEESLDDEDTRLGLHLALRARRMMRRPEAPPR